MEKNIRSRTGEVLIVVISAGAALLSAVLCHLSGPETARTVLLTMMACGCTIFAIELSRLRGGFLFDNGEKTGRFTGIYFLFLAGSLLFPFLPEGFWPFPVVFIGLMLFGNRIVGICAGSTLLLIAVLTEPNMGGDLFLIYFLGGLSSILVFSRAGQGVALPVWISLALHFLTACMDIVLIRGGVLDGRALLGLAGGSVLYLALLAVVWKAFCRLILYEGKDACAGLNDPEGPLLERLKECSREEYFHSIHTAYLCDKMAERLSLNQDEVKAAGYYHRIGMLEGMTSWENTQRVVQEYDFPDKVKDILREYLQDDRGIVSKEGAVLLFADTVVSSIDFLFSEEAGAKLDYGKLVEMISKKVIDSGELKNCRLSLCELEEIKKVLVEEEMYYEFLR